ncbi:hypothetical protein CERZMDRAFT_96883 [Cercospora zeae-maydis SCOH1-5]|uniref:Uncharacterized protein n=1 Tax=Cercospora zeae-maydis SCOH1-5 TaxID=717836 RepID=A0A6A6FIC2_9PEZI|nr:hypothetical protein CERZMDRAFT_96883 [Cercospora zeae-maydis SCOH1-5]
MSLHLAHLHSVRDTIFDQRHDVLSKEADDRSLQFTGQVEQSESVAWLGKCDMRPVARTAGDFEPSERSTRNFGSMPRNLQGQLPPAPIDIWANEAPHVKSLAPSQGTAEPEWIQLKSRRGPPTAVDSGFRR